MTNSTVSGHKVYSKNGEWRYRDTDELISSKRPCKCCGRIATSKGHDACIPDLPNIRNACCGHGNEEDTYIEYNSGVIIRGSEAIRKLKSFRKG